MLYKALVSFSGTISMAMGEVREITDEPIADDLLKAHYIEAFVADDKSIEDEPEKAENKPKKRKKGEVK